VKNLGEVDYFSLMKLAKLMIGNSSSGIVEAVSFKLPVVNIGTRQDGKLKPKNVIDTGYSLNEIKRGIKKALKIDFLNKIKKIKNPYHSNDESKKIAKMILNIKSNQKILRKKFININN
jgi:UDP-N-acetylglucosamine 2-epimerase